MMRRLKYLIAVALGFSTACSTVREAPRSHEGKERDDAPAASDSTEVTMPPRVVVMYGVRPPVTSESLERQRMERMKPDSLPPVAETPREADVQIDE